MPLPSRSLEVVLYFTYALFTCGLVQSAQGAQTASSNDSSAGLVPADCPGSPCISTPVSASVSLSTNNPTRSLTDPGPQTSQVASITISTVTDVIPSFSFSTALPIAITITAAPSSSETSDSKTLTDSTSISQVPDPSQSITNTADSGGGQAQGTHTKSPQSSTSTTSKDLPSSVVFVNPMIVVTLPTVISGNSTIVVSATGTEYPSASATLSYVLPPAVFKSSGVRSSENGFGTGIGQWRRGGVTALGVVVGMVFL